MKTPQLIAQIFPAGQRIGISPWLLSLMVFLGFSARCLAQCCPPVINTQPQSQTVVIGNSVTFTVVASSATTLSYRWFKNGSSLPATASSYSIPNVQTNDAGDYAVLVSNAAGSVISQSATLTVVSSAIPLPEALDGSGLFWSPGGNAPWTGQTTVTHDGVDAARSGSIINNQESWLETTVAGPKSVTFFWKVSSENGFDFLEFYIGGVLQIGISGEVDWQQRSFTTPAGSQVLRWRYSKDGSVNSGQDKGWVDQVTVTPTGSLQVNLGPAGAVSAGAQWRVDGGTWQNSGATVSGLSVGGHIVGFKAVSGWTSPGDQNVTVNANQTTSTTAIYMPAANDFTIVVGASPSAGGTVSGGGTYTSGSVVTVIATANSGYVFANWTENGTVVSVSASYAFTINANRNLVANFTASSLPPNDSFASRITITGLTNTVTGFNADATKEAGEPNHAGNVGGKSVWWTWTAPNNRGVTVDTIGSSFDTVLAVYAGNSLPVLTLVASDDDSGGAGASKVTFSAVAGTTYQIAIDGFDGASGTIVLNIRPASPQITSQPQSQTVIAGNTVTFSVLATGTAPLSYQWRFNSTNISGAINASYTLTNVQLANAGSYSVVVSNVAGTATSSNATLTVETVRLSSARFTTNGFQFRLTGPVGTYVIEASTDLVFWSSIVTNSTSPAGVLNFTDSGAANFASRFYRASLQ